MSSIDDLNSSGPSGQKDPNKTTPKPENLNKTKPSASSSGVRNTIPVVKVSATSETDVVSNLENIEAFSSEANSGVSFNSLVTDLNSKIDSIKKETSKFDNITDNIKKLTLKIEAIQTSSKEWIDGWEEKNQSIILLNGKLEKIPLSTYNFFILLFPPVILLVLLIFIIVLIFAKAPSMSSLNTRIDNLSTNITESSPNNQILKLKEDTTDIKSKFVELNKKGIAEIKDLIGKIGIPNTLSNDIAALKTSVDNLLKNPFSKKDLDDIKIALKTLGENKSTSIPPQFIGQPTESSKFAKELSSELLKAKSFTDEISKFSNQTTKDALKSVDDKIKIISDSIKINAKTDKTDDSLRTIDEKFKLIIESMNRNSKTEKTTEDKLNKLALEVDTLNKSLQKVQVNSKPKHPFLLICSTTPSFNPVKLEKLGPMFRDLTDTVLKTNNNIEWKIGTEFAGNFNLWFENDKELKLFATSYSQAFPDYTTKFLSDKILAGQLKNDILSDVIIIVPPGTGGGLKTNAGTPIFMNGVRVHVVYLILASNNILLSDSMIEWSKLSASNAGGVFSFLKIAETKVGVIDETDLQKQLKDHLVRLVQKFN